MKLKTLIWLALFALIGYMGYGYAVLHFNRASMVYKNYADAVMRNEPEKARLYTAGPSAGTEAFQYSRQRQKELLSGQIKFSYFSINQMYYSSDGEYATIDAVHVVRVDPPGQSSTFGSVTKRFPERVQLEKRDGIWKVKTFSDQFTENRPST